MSKKYIPIYLIALFVIGINSLNFTNNKAGVALQVVKKQFQTGIHNFENTVNQFQEAAKSLDNSEASLKKLQETHIANRLAFKELEFLAEYYNGAAVTKHLNGAPLPKPEPAVAEKLIIEPTGLQVLDELVFSDDPLVEKKEIVRLAKKLSGEYQSIKKYLLGLNMTHRHIFEAVRQELVRVFTLGVTGFDTPGSANAIPEAVKAMESISEAMSAYYPLISDQDKILVDECAELFKNAITFLKNGEFETFDRLTFVKEYIDPLYGIIYKMHRKTGIETVDEVNSLPMALNYHATSIFSNDFLNDDYYVNLDLSHPAQKKRIELGKLLFFDPILSSDNQRSCASCHQPEKAFTDGERKSVSKDGRTVLRNAPTVLNSVFADKYFYDLRQTDLEKQTKHVVFDSREFDTNFTELVKKLKESKEYTTLFANAYSDYPQYSLTASTITNVLASYVASLYSFNSPVDKYIRGESNELSESAKNGFNIFMGKAACGTCHFAPTFNGSVPPLYTESESEVLGVPTTNDTVNVMLDPDLGRRANNLRRDDVDFYEYSFKTVTVRNVALTAPYMHNGVYNTLEEVVDFYNRGGGAGMGIEGLDHQTLPFDNLSLTKKEQADVVAFMEALTDNPFHDHAPETLPKFDGQPEWNKRKVGGIY